ncbi:MAG: type II secretion system protein F, partial [bacterium]
MIGGLSYPGVLIAMLGGMLYLFGVQVIPNFEQLLPKDQWQGLAYGMAIMSTFAQKYMVPTALGLVLFVVVFSITAPRWTGRLRSLLDRVPPWS